MRTPRSFETLRVSALIPAYNEAGNLGAVLAPLMQVKEIAEVIVVSDGSTDETAAVARSAGAKTLQLPHNVGKTEAVLSGVREASHPFILLCDADLLHLTERHVRAMLLRYCEGWDMIIMDKGGQPWVFKSLLKSVPAISGTRLLEKRLLLEVPFRTGDRFRFENRINDHFFARGWSIAVSPAEEVRDRRKYVKYSFWRGLRLDIRGACELMAGDGVWSILHNLMVFRRIYKLAQEVRR